MSNNIKPIVANKPAAVAQAPLAVAEPVAQVEIIRPVSVIANQFTFTGELIDSVLDGVTMDESIRYSVSLVNEGEQTRNRGAIVAASKLRGIGDKKEAQVFRDALCAQFVLEAVEKAIATFIPDSKRAASTVPNQLEAHKKAATVAAEKRFSNLQQAIATAVIILDHPELLPTHKSVFSLSNYTQMKRYLPIPKEDADDKEEINAVRKVILPMLKAGAPQQALKDAASAVKTKLSEKPEAPDARTPEQKAKEAAKAKEDALVNRCRLLVDKVNGAVGEWEALASIFVERGSTMAQAQASLGAHEMMHNDPSKGTLKSKIRTLAILAGLDVKQP